MRGHAKIQRNPGPFRQRVVIRRAEAGRNPEVGSSFPGAKLPEGNAIALGGRPKRRSKSLPEPSLWTLYFRTGLEEDQGRTLQRVREHGAWMERETAAKTNDLAARAPHPDPQSPGRAASCSSVRF